MRTKKHVISLVSVALFVISPQIVKAGTTARCTGGDSINTAIGCVPYTNTESFMSFILTWAFGIGGGIAFMLMLLAGFQVIASGGDPKKLQAGKELLTSAISGLILLVLSAFILRFVGINILGIL